MKISKFFFKNKTNLLLLLGTIFLIFLILEFAIWLSGINIILIKHTLYMYLNIDSIHQISDDPNRLYELKPNTNIIHYSDIHYLETKYNSTRVSINSLGFRGIESKKEKPPGIYRIIILGGSNTFGVSVDDEDTYPKLLQDRLDLAYPGQYEVWNAGLEAYVDSQKVAYARYIVREFDPDLLIFQVNNIGRRSFQKPSQDLRPLFDENPELYQENIPLLISRNEFLRKVHYRMLSFSNLYRLMHICINNAIVDKYFNDCRRDSDRPVEFCGPATEGIRDTQKSIKEQYEYLGDMISRRELMKFIEEYQGGIIIFSPVSNCDRYRDLGAECFFLDSAGKPGEYRFIHPPSYVYEWYADELFDMLMVRGLLNKV